MSNAERQARYRSRLKTRASFDTLAERTAEAVDEAISSLWTFFNRPGPSGNLWADIEGCETLADYRAMLAGDPDALLEICRDLTTYSVGLEADEAKAIQRLVDIANALALAGYRKGGKVIAAKAAIQ